MEQEKGKEVDEHLDENMGRSNENWKANTKETKGCVVIEGRQLFARITSASSRPLMSVASSVT